MLIFRRSLSCALLLSLVALAGCEMFSSEAWQRPSPLSGRPPPPVDEKHENQGGFTVLVGAPGQPDAARVVADVGTFAQGRGFVRESATNASPPVDPAPARYLLGDIKLDVSYRTTDLRVVASLHSFSSQLSRKFINQFYQDFRQRYAAGYGDEGTIYENDGSDDSGGSLGAGGGRGGRGGGR